ncbi:hypothetical protein [Fibrobacter sp.]|uniref:hypothetical protein n=1 Tax=Fibrobacter sp. TaxID=35828 RepID=UPI0025C681E2|nr:hypothetical protein [Fibrobacter sp.]MBR3073501.1 hypothetical protein [Fibrobacter sp.]
MKSKELSCQEVCFQLFADKTDYYHRWYHAKPMLISSERRDELRHMQALLYKCIAYMAEHYREWVPKYMPLNEKVMDILDRQSHYPFRAGAYRPDYLISEEGKLLLVEITSRFFGHGIWFSYPSVIKAEQFMAAHPDASWENQYNELMTYMRDAIPAKSPIYVLKSSDRTSEIALYKKFYEYYGHEVTIYEANEVEEHIDKWSHDAVVFSALNQEDILSFKMETLQAMINVRMINDFRTIFLAHDKRFLHLIFVDEFTRECLTEEEAKFLRDHTIPTYMSSSHPEIWKDALTHKDQYILKPYDLGKSVGLYAGVMTDDETWKKNLAASEKGGFILQPFIKQRTYPCEWEGKHYDDYVCGMMLCMDDRYFDSGMIRTSSAPVTNKVDDRKMSVIHSDDEKLKQYCNVL